MKEISIQDIANKLGVSKALVSFVLNGKGKEKRISDQTCRQVFEVARELNYRPNQIAKWLRTGKTQTIGLIIADISNPFFGKLGREIEQEASRLGYKIIFCNSDENADKFEKQLEMLENSRVDGFIICPPCGSNARIETLAKTNVPYILIDRYFPEIDSNYIIIDNFEAAYYATDHLLQKGYRNIALLTVNDDLTTMHDRTEGFKQALCDAGIEIETDLVFKLPFSHEKENVHQAIRQLLSRSERIEAIFFSSSKIGLMGLETIFEMDLSVPADLAVVSFDDPDYYKVCFTPITAIAQPLQEMGKQAVQILTGEIESGLINSPPKKIVLKTKFIERKSSGG